MTATAGPFAELVDLEQLRPAAGEYARRIAAQLVAEELALLGFNGNGGPTAGRVRQAHQSVSTTTQAPAAASDKTCSGCGQMKPLVHGRRCADCRRAANREREHRRAAASASGDLEGLPASG